MKDHAHPGGLTRRDFFLRLGGALLAPRLGGLPRAASAQVQNDLFWVKNIPDDPFCDPSQRNDHIGLDSLLYLMADKGLRFFRSTGGHPLAGPAGLIAPDDVVIVKVNAQWKYRGCTNSDLVRGLIQRILDHPDGFEGEVVIIENGQGRASLNCDTGSGYGDQSVQANAVDRRHSFLYLVNNVFADTRVSAFLLDPIRTNFIGQDEHAEDGYRRLENVSYPCFTTNGGRRVELREGVWDGSRHRQNLKLINVPVLKHHDTGGSEITASLKHFYGVLSMADGNSGYRHYSGLGETCGKMMALVATPVLNILDAIWVSHEALTGYPAENTFPAKEILASQDPVALDYWAAKHVLYPIDSNFRHHPDFSGIERWLRDARDTINSRGGLLDPEKGIVVDRVTKNEDEIRVHSGTAFDFLNQSRVAVSRSALLFVASAGEGETPAKSIRVSVTGPRASAWSIEKDADWLTCLPSSGAGDGEITVRVHPEGLKPGKYAARLAIHCPGAANSPQTVLINLNVLRSAKRNRPGNRLRF